MLKKARKSHLGKITRKLWIKFFPSRSIFFIVVWVYYFKRVLTQDFSQMCWAHVKMGAGSLGWKELRWLIFWGILLVWGFQQLLPAILELSEEVPFWCFQNSPSRTMSLWPPRTLTTLSAHFSWPQKVCTSYNILGSECLLLSPRIRSYFLLAAWRYSENYWGGFVECFELLRWKELSSNFVDNIIPIVSGSMSQMRTGEDPREL